MNKHRLMVSWMIFLIYTALYSQALAMEDLPAIVKKIGPSVVAVQTYDKEGKALGQGSGFFINEKGNVITNRHVLEGASHAEVKTVDGKVYPVKEVLAEDREGDIILVSVAIPGKEVRPLPVSASLPDVGERVVVIGNPLGLEQTVSDGIVSAVRDVPSFGKVVQITAPISPGSSGSPVVNMKGEVIGVATFQMVKGQNLNFSIPGKRVADLTPGKGIVLAAWEEERKKRLGSAEEIYSKGLPFLWAENYKDALPFFEEAVKRNPSYAEAYFQIGVCNVFLLRDEEAIRAFTLAIRIKPDFAVAYYNRGTAYKSKGLYDQAISDYNKALEINPRLAEAYYSRGGAYASKGQLDQAISDYNKAIEINPRYAAAYNNRGVTYDDKGLYDQAISDYTKALEIDPGYAVAYNNRGNAYKSKGLYDQAISDYNKALEIDPRFAGAYRNRGLAYKDKGQYDQAISDYNKALEIDPRLAEAYNSRGFLYLVNLGDKVKGCADWKRACELGECGNYNLAKEKGYCR